MKRDAVAALYMESTMTDRALIKGWRNLEAYVGRSRVQLWRDIGADRFPAPIEIGDNSVAWFIDEVDEHLRSLPRRKYGAPKPGAA